MHRLHIEHSRGFALVLNELLELPEFVTNVLLTEEEKEEHDPQVRKYIIANNLPSYDSQKDGIDEWWLEVNSLDEYPALCKLDFVLLSCVHGPAIESSYNVMGNIMDVKLGKKLN